MGKNKGPGKKANVFKLAGAKSLKAKSKAKPVTGNLKKLNEIVRTNVNKIDKELASLQRDLRRQEKVKSDSNQAAEIKNKSETIKKKQAELELEKQKTLQKLEQMQF